jgi:hypothetical protein
MSTIVATVERERSNDTPLAASKDAYSTATPCGTAMQVPLVDGAQLS